MADSTRATLATTEQPLVPEKLSPANGGSRRLMITGVVAAILLAAVPVTLWGFFGNQVGPTAIGPLVGGISLWLTALAIWIQAYTITVKNFRESQRVSERNFKIERYTEAVNSFRVLYDEFWSDKISQARRWIISVTEYNDTLRLVLVARNKTGKFDNQLTEPENKILDTLDQFLSVLVRIKSFTASGELESIEPWQRDLWLKILHGKWWIEFIDDHRAELRDYIRVHWEKEFDEFLKTPEAVPSSVSDG